MRMKVYTASTMKEAIDKIKEDLGVDAQILYTRKYKDGGFLGLGAKEVFEVTAAVEDEANKKTSKKKTQEKKKSAPPPQPKTAATSVLPPSVLTQYKTNGTQEGVVLAEKTASPSPTPVNTPMFKSDLAQFMPVIQPAANTKKPAPPLPDNVGAKENPAASSTNAPGVNNVTNAPNAPIITNSTNAMMPTANVVDNTKTQQPTFNPQIPANLPNVSDATSRTNAPQRVNRADTPEFVGGFAAAEEQKPQRRRNSPRIIKANDVPTEKDEAFLTNRNEKNQNYEGNFDDAKKIKRLEDELAQMKALLAEVMSKEQPKEVLPLHEALRLQEVTQEILKDMAGKSGAGETLADWHTDAAKITLRSFLTQVVNFAGKITLTRKGGNIVALIGPTGVGKTTTLAKIAAKFVLEEGARTALITADTYRISAVEQLKTYSDIIGLPLDIVYSPEELRKAIRRHADKDLVLIDTAGRSQHNDFQMKELKDLLRVNRRIEKHLVISATTKERDAADIIEKFSVCEPDRVIFTKTDETNSVGMILNLLYQKELALSYFANGQSVPDDIIPASAEAFAELLLRE